MTVKERTPKLFDYIAGAILTNGLATMALYLAAYEPFFQLLLIPLWCFSAGVATYLVCMRTSKGHLLIGVKTAVLSVVFGVVIIPTLENLDLGQLLIVLVCFLVGAFGGAFYALRGQLKQPKKVPAPPSAAEP